MSPKTKNVKNIQNHQRFRSTMATFEKRKNHREFYIRNFNEFLKNDNLIVEQKPSLKEKIQQKYLSPENTVNQKNNSFFAQKRRTSGNLSSFSKKP